MNTSGRTLSLSGWGIVLLVVGGGCGDVGAVRIEPQDALIAPTRVVFHPAPFAPCRFPIRFFSTSTRFRSSLPRVPRIVDVRDYTPDSVKLQRAGRETPNAADAELADRGECRKRTLSRSRALKREPRALSVSAEAESRDNIRLR